MLGSGLGLDHLIQLNLFFISHLLFIIHRLAFQLLLTRALGLKIMDLLYFHYLQSCHFAIEIINIKVKYISHFLNTNCEEGWPQPRSKNNKHCTKEQNIKALHCYSESNYENIIINQLNNAKIDNLKEEISYYNKTKLSINY